MKVTLIDYPVNGADLLIFTKQIRLGASPARLEEVGEWSRDRKLEELEYMVNTIKSSWEFLSYTFCIEDVSRAFTHQFVRNRQGSYAQQTMRMLDKGGFTYHTGPSIVEDRDARIIYNQAMEAINDAYEKLIRVGVKVEDARGILPTNIHTNIVARYNLRTLSELVASRSSPRTQGEFRTVLERMYNEVTRVHPWAAPFLRGKKADAAEVLDHYISEDLNLSDTDKLALIKMVDALRV